MVLIVLWCDSGIVLVILMADSHDCNVYLVVLMVVILIVMVVTL